METIRLDLELITPIVTPFHSDTIFGHFAWGIYYLFGEDKLRILLQSFNERPFIIFSNGFEKDKLPKPFLYPYLMSPKEMDLSKKYKKLAFIPKEWIIENIDKLSDKKLFDLYKKDVFNECLKNPCDKCNENKKSKKLDKSKKTVLNLKNSINRYTNTTNEGLYSIKESFVKSGYKVSIYVKYDKERIKLDEIKKVFDFISKRGYGKDKNIGKGKFVFEIIDDFEEKSLFEINKNRPFYLNLSNMFSDKDLYLNYGKKFTKFPKTGGYLSFNQPFKNPIVLFQPGSTFLVKGYKEFYGQAKDNVFKKGYFHSGYSIGIFFYGVDDE